MDTGGRPREGVERKSELGLGRPGGRGGRRRALSRRRQDALQEGERGKEGRETRDDRDAATTTTTTTRCATRKVDARL